MISTMQDPRFHDCTRPPAAASHNHPSNNDTTMKYTAFEERRFRASVDQALHRIRQILETSRHPRLAEDEDHVYDDKYAVVDFCTNTAVAATMNALEKLGLQSSEWKQAMEWVQNKKSVTLRFEANDTCEFFKEQSVEVPMGPEYEKTTTTTPASASGSNSSFFGSASKIKTEKVKVTQQVKEYHWKVGIAWKILLFPGTSVDTALVLDSRESSTMIVTSGSNRRPPPPIPAKTAHPSMDVNCTWLFQQMNAEQACDFSILREEAKTPRRNKQTDEAVSFFQSLQRWSSLVQNFFSNRIEAMILGNHRPVDKPAIHIGGRYTLQELPQAAMNGHLVSVTSIEADGRIIVEAVSSSSGLPPTMRLRPNNLQPVSTTEAMPSQIRCDSIFLPIVPLLEEGAVLTNSDVGRLLAEQVRSIDEYTETLAKLFPPRALVKAVSIAEASIILAAQHIEQLAFQYQDSVDYVEDLLKEQLTQAIGKEVQMKDFDQFMAYHSRRLFGPSYAPTPFSYAIRRPGMYPNGILTLEGTRSKDEPVETFVRAIPGGDTNPPIVVPLNAATRVEVTGNRFLHGWVLNRFKAKPKSDYQLVGRARQFSSFMIIVGKMAGANEFSPKQAIILQNKDEVMIPILTNMLPTAKEFKDSIASLSPEQRAFAEEFRKMQLESSVFGVCVVQLKPQLEKVLGLPDGALMKEIQLTQDLLSLFVDYQIPSDILSFDGPSTATRSEKVEAVREHVTAVLAVIDASKEKQLLEEERKADMRAELSYAAAPDTLEDESSTATPKSTRARFRKSGMAPPMNAEMATFGAPMMAMATMAPPPSAPGGGYGGAPRIAAPVPAPAPIAKSSKTSRPNTPTNILPQSNELATDDDFTALPKILDTELEKYDSSVRTTILKAGPTWTRARQQNLLTPMTTSSIGTSEIESETKKAFDLLDALSRSGSLPLECAELHVVVAVSHCFSNDVMGTIVQDNVNPIEQVERTCVVVAQTVYGPAHRPSELIEDEQQVRRLTTAFPLLFAD